MDGYLYLLVLPRGVVKMGRTVDVSRRIREYRYMTGVADAEFARVWGPADDVVALESGMLEVFRSRFAVERGREYFAATGRDAALCFDSFVLAVSSGSDVRYPGRCPMEIG